MNIFANENSWNSFILINAPCIFCGPTGSVDIATDYGLDGPGIVSRWGEIFRPSRPALGPTQPPVQWVPGLSRGKVRPRRAADHSPPSSAVVMKSRAIPLARLRATTGPVAGTLYLYLTMDYYFVL